MTYRVSIESTGESFACAGNVHVLEAMEHARCRAIPVGCRNGGCGACKVCIKQGRYATRKMNRAVISEQEQLQGCVLACKTYPLGDLVVQVLGRAWQHATPTTDASSGPGYAGARSPKISPDKET
jgi:ferredoxin